MKKKLMLIIMIMFFIFPIDNIFSYYDDPTERIETERMLKTATIDELIQRFEEVGYATTKKIIIEEIGKRENIKAISFLKKIIKEKNKKCKRTELSIGLTYGETGISACAYVMMRKIEMKDLNEDEKLKIYEKMINDNFEKGDRFIAHYAIEILSNWNDKKPLAFLRKLSRTEKENYNTLKLQLELYKYDNAGKAKVLCNFMKEPNHSSIAYIAVGQLLDETGREGWQYIKDLFIDIADKKVILNKNIEYNYRIDETIIVNVVSSLAITGNGMDTLNVIKSNLHKFDKKLQRKIIRYAMGGITNNADEQTCYELISLAKKYDDKLVKETINRIVCNKRFQKLAWEEEKKFEMELKKKNGGQK